MPTIYDRSPEETINKAAEILKKDIKMPEWAKYVKTSSGKQRPPEDPGWYFKRSASILRKVYKLGPIGTNKLKIKYGTKKNRGHKPEKFKEGSGKIIRSILQQLEQLGYVKKDKKGSHAGRIITPKGRSFLDTLEKNGKQRSGASQPAPKPAAETAPTPQTN